MKREVAGSGDTITFEQALEAESRMIVRELNGGYSSVYLGWQARNLGNLNSAGAAYDAGRAICLEYEKPSEMVRKSGERADRAVVIHGIMTGL